MNSNISTNSLFRSGTAPDLIFITFIWCLAIILVNPAGDFPLNDDWSYGIAVKRLLEEGTYLPTQWTSMTLISQVIWGAAFCSLFGFSFEVLRISTLVLSFLGVCGLYLLIRQLGQHRFLALLAAFTVAFNPIFFSLSNTFMTDVPFIAFTVMALLFLARDLTVESSRDLLLGTLFATTAILCRQTGLFIPIAFGLAALFKKGFKLKQLARAFFPFVICFGVLLAYQYWLEHTGKTPELYGLQVQKLLQNLQNPANWLDTIFFNTFLSILYLGFFMTPVLILLFFSRAASEPAVWAKTWVKKGVIPLSILIGLGVLYLGRLMPIGKNILHKAGIGPLSLYDVYMLNLPNAPNLPEALWVCVTILSVVGGAVLLIYLVSGVRFISVQILQKSSDERPYITLFFLLGAAIYFSPFLFVPTYFDRYVLVLMVLLVLMLLSFTKKSNFTSTSLVVAGSALVIVFTFFSLALTHDYLAWNRARWNILGSLLKNRSISYLQVHGGFEYNGLTLFSDSSLNSNRGDLKWPKEGDQVKYMLAFGEVPGYHIISQYSYNRWLPPYHDKLFLLEKIDTLATKSRFKE